MSYIEKTVFALKQELDKLKRDNELYLTIMDCVYEGIYAINEKEEIVVYNKAMEEAEGYCRQDVLGVNEKLIYKYDTFSEHGTLDDEIKYSKKPQINKICSYYADNGKRYSLLVNGFPFFYDGKYAGLFTVGCTYHQSQEMMKIIINWQDIFDNKKNTTVADTDYTFNDVIGNSKSMRIVLSLARTVATKDSPVMIVGETGTGKEIIAQGIHHASHFRKGPFIPVNCAAIPDTLLESVLFGTVKGAFTGAVDMPGLFEQANCGTIFLDELNLMPLTLQAKLLRVVQERKLRRIGSSKETPLNCRIISSTNVDPLESSDDFRTDLLFRLQVVSLYLPPLHKRKEDIPALVKHFYSRYNERFQVSIQDIDEEFLQVLLQYKWPGNVRELGNIIESAMVFVDKTESVLRLDHLPVYTQQRLRNSMINPRLSAKEKECSLRQAMRAFERSYICDALIENHWNITNTARKLGLQRQNLGAKMKEHHLKKP